MIRIGAITFFSLLFFGNCTDRPNVINGLLPDSPGSLTALATSISQVDLTWSDNSDNETGFKIERKTSNTGFVEIDTVSANTNRYSDIQVIPNTTYIYRVISYNSEGNSNQYSNEAVATINTSGTNIPLPPLNLTSSFFTNINKIKLNWIDNSTNETGFKIERKTDNGVFGPLANVGENVTTFIDSTIEINKVYSYRVYSYNNSGFSATYSNVSEISTIQTISFSALNDSLIVTDGQNTYGLREGVIFDSALSNNSDVAINFSFRPDLVVQDPSLILLPDTYFQISPLVISSGNLFQSIDIFFNALDDSLFLGSDKTYGIGLQLNSANLGYGINSINKTLLIRMKFRNKFDGLYNATGTFQDVSANGGGFFALYPKQYYLKQRNRSSVDMCSSINGEIIPGYQFLASSSPSYYGSFGLMIFFDRNTNLITEVRNYYGDPSNPGNFIGNPGLGSGAPNYQSSNFRSASLDPTGINSLDAISRNIRIKYFMLQPTVVPNGPRAFINETLNYLGTRPW